MTTRIKRFRHSKYRVIKTVPHILFPYNWCIYRKYHTLPEQKMTRAT